MQRLVGCLAGGFLGGAILLLSQHSPVVMTIGLVLGVVIGRHIENGPPSMSYAGLQFVLAFVVVLVPDNYDSAQLTPGYERLLGILFGMVLLEPVVLIAHLIARRGGRSEPPKVIEK
jgi:uncharacterized membrane protein YccC